MWNIKQNCAAFMWPGCVHVRRDPQLHSRYGTWFHPWLARNTWLWPWPSYGKASRGFSTSRMCFFLAHLASLSCQKDWAANFASAPAACSAALSCPGYKMGCSAASTLQCPSRFAVFVHRWRLSPGGGFLRASNAILSIATPRFHQRMKKSMADDSMMTVDTFKHFAHFPTCLYFQLWLVGWQLREKMANSVTGVLPATNWRWLMTCNWFCGSRPTTVDRTVPIIDWWLHPRGESGWWPTTDGENFFLQGSNPLESTSKVFLSGELDRGLYILVKGDYLTLKGRGDNNQQ